MSLPTIDRTDHPAHEPDLPNLDLHAEERKQLTQDIHQTSLNLLGARFSTTFTASAIPGEDWQTTTVASLQALQRSAELQDDLPTILQVISYYKRLALLT